MYTDVLLIVLACAYILYIELWCYANQCQIMAFAYKNKFNTTIHVTKTFRLGYSMPYAFVIHHFEHSKLYADAIINFIKL